MHSQRLKTLVENEKFIQKGFEESDSGEDDDSDNAEVDEETAMQEIQAAVKAGKKAQLGGFEDEDDDDSDDPDFEDNAGEFALYDSPLEHTDELVSIKNTLDEIY